MCFLFLSIRQHRNIRDLQESWCTADRKSPIPRIRFYLKKEEIESIIYAIVLWLVNIRLELLVNM